MKRNVALNIKDGEITAAGFARLMKVSRPTMYWYVRKYESVIGLLHHSVIFRNRQEEVTEEAKTYDGAF